jgi:hypothetical protein
MIISQWNRLQFSFIKRRKKTRYIMASHGPNHFIAVEQLIALFLVQDHGSIPGNDPMAFPWYDGAQSS